MNRAVSVGALWYERAAERRNRDAAWPVALRVPLVAVLIFVLALAPRLLNRDLFPTSDEDSWMRRAGGFTYGLANGQLGRTYQNGHPGVTTMWIATLAQGPDGALRFADRVHGLRFVGQVPGYMEGLAQARIGFAVLGALGTAACALLVWRLFGPLAGALAGVILALEPFLVANSQLVHVDGPLTTFTAIAALAAVVYWRASGHRAYLLLSAVAAGLAVLSKTPAIFLLAFVPVMGLLRPHPGPLTLDEGAASAPRGREGSPPLRGSGATVRGPSVTTTLVLDLLLWAVVALVTVVALWPALWVLGPTEVLGRVVAFTRETGAQPDEVGSFFAGQVTGDPGPLYYPVAVLFRLSPLLMLGLVALAVCWPRLDRSTHERVGWLLLYILGFGLMMTLGSKKFDRYLLPIFPMLGALAAVGWAATWAWLHGRSAPGSGGTVVGRGHLATSGGSAATGAGEAASGRGRAAPDWLVPGLAGVALVVAMWPLATTWPYALAYYNPLLGGGAVAQRVVMVGNGEGLDQAAAWLRAQPDAASLKVAAHSWDILTALAPIDGEPLREGVPDDADYIVTYGRRIQMHRWGPSLARFLTANPPVYVVQINGIEYVHIHPGPQRGRRI